MSVDETMVQMDGKRWWCIDARLTSEPMLGEFAMASEPENGEKECFAYCLKKQGEPMYTVKYFETQADLGRYWRYHTYEKD